MKKGIIRSVKERDLTKVGAKHVIITRNTDYCGEFNPIVSPDNLSPDNLFYLHSNIKEFDGNESQKDYPGLPVEEILDEDGCGTGEYNPKEDAIISEVSAYIHGGIWLNLGNGSGFPDQQFDVTRKAAWMWTTKERFCKLIGEDKWMHIYDVERGEWKPAKTREEFLQYLRDEAKRLLDLWQKWSDGEIYGYKEVVSYVPYKRLYPDGHTEDEVKWEEEDETFGYIINNINEIPFPRSEEWEVFDESGDFVGKEYDIE